MTVSSPDNQVTYAGDGTTTVFPIPYYFLQNTDISISLVDADGNVTDLVYISDFTVSGAGNMAGGSATILVAPPSNVDVYISRNVPETQEINYIPNDAFPAESHERGLDKLTMITQQLKRLIGGSLQQTLGGFAWDALGLRIKNVGSPVDSGDALNLQYFLDYLSNAGGAIPQVHFLTGDGVLSTFSLPGITIGDAAAYIVTLDGIDYRPNIEYSIDATAQTITFLSPPPNGTKIMVRVLGYSKGIGDSNSISFIQAGTGAVARTSQDKMREAFSIKDFGAIGNGVVNDTVAVQACINASAAAGVLIHAPAGNYLTNQLIFPANFKGIIGEGPDTLFTASGTLVDFQGYLDFRNCTDVFVDRFAVKCDQATYPNVHGIRGVGLVRGTFSNILMKDSGGFIGIYMVSSCADVVLEDIFYEKWHASMFSSDATCNRMQVSGLRSNYGGPYTGGSISLGGGSGHRVTKCRLPGAGSSFFTLSLFATSYSVANDNVIFGTVLEAAQITDGSFNQIVDNLIICNAGHHDFGISIFSNDADISHNKISGNTIIGSGGPSIGISAAYTPVVRVCQLNMISDNLCINPCTFTTIVPAAIEFLGGGTCTGNVAQNNTIFDSGNKIQYGAYEWNSGGIPDNNRMIHNSCLAGAGFISEGYAIGPNSKVWDLVPYSFTPTIASSGGTLTSASATMRIKRMGQFAEILLKATITTNGTGSGFIFCSTPFAAAQLDGGLAGRAAAVSGKAVTGANAGSGNIGLWNYDGTYPGASSEVITVSGTMKITA